MLESRLIGETGYHIYDDLPQFLTEVDKVRPKRVFSFAENGSGSYELIAGFVEHSKSASLYLASEHLDQPDFEEQQHKFQRYLFGRQIPLLHGKIEVAAGGEILQFFAHERDWLNAVEKEDDPFICLARYCGGVYLAAVLGGICSLTRCNQPPTPGAVMRELQPHSDIGL